MKMSWSDKSIRSLYHRLVPRSPTENMLDQLANFFERINDWSGRALSWLTLLMVVTTFLIVVLRYGFNWGSIAMQEAVLYFHAAVFMGGVAYTLRLDGHVRVDIFYSQWSARAQAWVNLIGTLLFLLPFCAFILWSSFDYVIGSWALLEGSREAGGLPLVFLLKSLIPLMAILLFLQGLAMLIRNLNTLRGAN